MRNVVAGFLFCVSTYTAFSQNAETTYLRGGTVIDMTGQAPYQADVEIRGGRIGAIGRKLTVPAGAKALDISGEYILPGFTTRKLV